MSLSTYLIERQRLLWRIRWLRVKLVLVRARHRWRTG